MKPFLFLFVSSTAFFILSCGSSATESSDATHKEHSVVREISILHLDSLKALYPSAILIDVRSDEEWTTGHLEQASFISFDWDYRIDTLRKLPANRPALVYCEAGGRSGVVTEELRLLGHPMIIDLIGGMERWLEANGEVHWNEAIPLPH
jgi:rhodanese-related sulfurtransferase